MSMVGANPAGIGFVMETLDVTVVNRGTTVITKGDCVAFCTYDVTRISDDGLLATDEFGLERSVFASVEKGGDFVDGIQVVAGFFGVALETIPIAGASGQLRQPKGRVRVKGVVNAKVSHSGNASITSGMQLVVPDGLTAGQTVGYLDALGVGGTISAAHTSSRKIVGIALEGFGTAPTSNGTTMRVLFDGINGLGSGNNT